MTTPTKEQIEEVAKAIFITQRDEPIKELQYDGLSDWWDRYLRKETKSRYRAKAKIAIETWEKLKNSPK